jgi:hypothetical protein
MCAVVAVGAGGVQVEREWVGVNCTVYQYETVGFRSERRSVSCSSRCGCRDVVQNSAAVVQCLLGVQLDYCLGI